MQKDLKALDRRGVVVVGISYDSVEVLATFAEKQKITFPLLSDPDHKTIAAYGLLEQGGEGEASRACRTRGR